MAKKRFFLVVVLTLSAGCTAFGTGGTPGGTTPTSASTASPTPAPTETTTLTATSGSLDIPGVTDRRVTDGSALVAAHDATLRNTSVTAHRNLTLRYPNGTVAYQQLSTVRIGSQHDRLFADVSYSLADGLDSVTPRHGEPTTSMEVRLANRTYLAEATFEPSNVTYRGTAFNGSTSDTYELYWASHAGTGQRYLSKALGGPNATVGDAVTRDGTTLYPVESASPETPPSILSIQSPPRGAFGQPGNVSTTALVDERGVVHRSTTTYTTTVGEDDTPIQVEYTLRFTDVGSTTVERPSWYETALNRTDLSEFGS